MLLAVLFCLVVVVLVLLLFTCFMFILYLFAVSHGVLVFCLPGVVLSCCGCC